MTRDTAPEAGPFNGGRSSLNESAPASVPPSEASLEFAALDGPGQAY